MDDRQHADLANNIRDAIKKTWPGFNGDMGRLRTVVSQEIQKYRDMQIETTRITAFQGDYRFLSNFYPSEVEYTTEIYPTVEHAFQAMKTKDMDERKQIREADTPGQAKRLGQKCTLRPDWDNIKLDVMEHFLHKKFKTNPLHQQLMDTGSRELIEGNTWGDRFWGVDGTGQNNLGKLLMKIRDEENNEKMLLAGVF